jgi:hypothetical protein
LAQQNQPWGKSDYKKSICVDELALQGLEREPFGFRIEEKYHKELQNCEACEKSEGRAATPCRDYDGEIQLDNGIPEPVTSVADALTFRAHLIGKDFADIDPYDSTLAHGEEGNVRDKYPDKRSRVGVVGQEPCSGGEASGGAESSDE